ncbi:MAG: DUF3145 domain-containing protein [Mycobacteriales bacterium]
MPARGVVYVHSSPTAVCPHVEWAIARVLDTPVRLEWTDQPAAPGQLRAECSWSGRSGTGGRIAHALRAWSMLRYEVTEDPSPGADGERISYVPGRGVFRTAIGANGDIMVNEDRLRALLAEARRPEELAYGLERLLGAEWDDELEPFRHAGDGAPITWLHQVV